MCWAIKFSAFRSVIEKLPCKSKVLSDRATRRAIRPHTAVQADRIEYIKPLIIAPINRQIDCSIDFPIRCDNIATQEASKGAPPKEFKKTERGWVPKSETMRISSGSKFSGTLKT